MGVNAWHIIYRLNYPPGRIRWALISTHKQLTQQRIITPPITLLQWEDALGVPLPSHERDDSKRRGAAVCSRWTTPRHLAATPESFKDTTNSLVPRKTRPLPPNPALFTTAHLKDADLWRGAVVSAGRWSAHASPTLSKWDCAASTRISLQLVRNLQRMVARRRWMVTRLAVVCACVFVCHCKKKKKKNTKATLTHGANWPGRRRKKKNQMKYLYYSSSMGIKWVVLRWQPRVYILATIRLTVGLSLPL